MVTGMSGHFILQTLLGMQSKFDRGDSDAIDIAKPVKVSDEQEREYEIYRIGGDDDTDQVSFGIRQLG